MPHPHKRTWALKTLDRGLSYRLWFDEVAYRWECEVVGTRSEHREDQAAAQAGGGALGATASEARRAGGAPGRRGDGDSRGRAA